MELHFMLFHECECSMDGGIRHECSMDDTIRHVCLVVYIKTFTYVLKGMDSSANHSLSTSSDNF